MPPVIALLSDFGTRDWYVAAMKGEILKINPSARIVDITHEIEPQNVNQSAFVLWQAQKSFPKGTIFVAVVDPGVGSNRKLIAVKTTRAIFLAPDNGLLSFILSNEKLKEVREVSNKLLPHKNISTTFHGRDILAPLAAKLTKGFRFSQIGALFHVKKQPLRVAQLTKNQIVADIIYRDGFGNLVTNLETKKLLQWKKKKSIQAKIKNHYVRSTHSHYQQLPKKGAGFVCGSSGLVEIACRNSSAAKHLKVSAGYEIKITRWAKRPIKNKSR
jgi:S-adenosyl-L-methionine hydrolase (adenosine-forming)